MSKNKQKKEEEIFMDEVGFEEYAPRPISELNETKEETKSKNIYIVNIGRLNVRQAPSLTADIAKVVDKNDELEIESISGDWAKLKGQSLYVMTKYIVRKI